MSSSSRSAVSTVTATVDGRLWVVWSGGDDRIEAARTNQSATKLGAVVGVAPSTGTHSVYRLDASAGSGRSMSSHSPTRAGSDGCCPA